MLPGYKVFFSHKADGHITLEHILSGTDRIDQESQVHHVTCKIYSTGHFSLKLQLH